MVKLGSHETPTVGWLQTFAVGERRYVETSLERHEIDRRVITGKRGTARPHILRGREFSIHLHTAIATNKIGEVKYLLSVERIR